MLDVLSDGFRQARDKFRGKATLNAESIDAAIGEIRKSLLDADVEYGVAKKFLAQVKEKALGQEVSLKAGGMRVTPGDHFVKICQDELTALMGGPADAELTYATNRPTTIMMVGLQGAGKTTTTGKLTKFLMTKQKRKPLLVAADIYRPAAVEQLKVLGAKIGVPVFHLAGETPVVISKRAVDKAFELGCDTVLIDTAGRLAIDEALMTELDDIKATVKADNILLVCDAMMGQDAVQTAKTFDERLSLTGVVMTKLDGDARGGAALSIREVTGKPIKFLGMGEDLDRLEEFRPEGLASRILGMGDVVGLMHDFERVATEDRAEEAMRMLQGQFSFRDFYQQLTMIQQMGPLKDIMAKLPIGNLLPKGADLDDRELVKIKAMIDSMTESERVNPKLFNDSRIKRVARGSGRPAKEVGELLKKFTQMRGMMGMLGKNMGLLGKIPGVGQLAQMNQLRKMAAAGPGGMAGAMGGMGGMGGMGDLAQQMAGMMGGAGAPRRAASADERDKQKKLKKLAKKARKKNRKR
jgi:signal recognition particle subunit SRP54